MNRVERNLSGRFTVPIFRTFALEDWRQALGIGESGQAHGKLLALPGFGIR